MTYFQILKGKTMGLNYDGETEWTYIFPCDDYNEEISIEVTKEGIEIDFEVISWEEIDRARKIIEERENND